MEQSLEQNLCQPRPALKCFHLVTTNIILEKTTKVTAVLASCSQLKCSRCKKGDFRTISFPGCTVVGMLDVICFFNFRFFTARSPSKDALESSISDTYFNFAMESFVQFSNNYLQKNMAISFF